jgi:EAL domain-containing protein (putative c-di-GMP-specific phosphodiesterase class I)
VFQPIHSLKDGRVLGYEGLVRLQPDSGFDGPSSLFIAAEATRRTVELDVASARTVLRAAANLAPEQYLSINLSPRTLESDAFSPRELLALARQHGVLEEQLVIEITEREAIEDLTRVKAALEAFRRRGARIAVDDVGAGNAGLRLLREIEFDVMKVDLSLVRAGAADDASEAVLRALVELARSRRQTIVAEGIETTDQLEVVLGMRFDAGQGYLLGRPDVQMGRHALDLVALFSDVTPAVAA